MRLTFFFMILGLCAVPSVQADVRLQGALVIQDGYFGAKYLGEVFNDTDIPITNVKVLVTVKDASDAIIDLAEGYVDGYTDPGASYRDTYIPAGGTVPFYFIGDVDAEDIVSYTTTILYENTDAVITNPDEVVLAGDMNVVDDSYGAYLFGEVTNNSPYCIYFVRVVTAIKDANGNMLDLETSYIDGRNYMIDGTMSDNTMMYPNSTAPFTIMADVGSAEIGSYYSIITYSTAPETTYQYPGEEDIDVVGDINMVAASGSVRFLGEIQNDSIFDIYFATITVIVRDNQNKIIRIVYTYVDGSPYEISEDLTTDTHIGPGAKAPFEIYASVDSDDVASYEYIINYDFAESDVSVATTTPDVFSLTGNYPNPFNPVTTISFSLSEPMPVQLTIYNATGHTVEKLVNDYMEAGQHAVVWDASTLSSGVYFCRLTGNGRSEARKLMLMK